MHAASGFVGRAWIRITTTQPLFAWEALDDSPNLQTLREFLAAVTDARRPDSAPRREGTLGKMRLSAVGQALRAKLTG